MPSSTTTRQAEQDDFISLLLIDLGIFEQPLHEGRRTTKMGETRTLRMAPTELGEIKQLVEEIREGAMPINHSLDRFTDLPAVKRFMDQRGDGDAFERAARRYIAALRPDSGVVLNETDRYSMKVKSASRRQTPSPTPFESGPKPIQVGVYATRRFKKGEELLLRGCTADLSEEEDDQLRAEGKREFSVLWSDRRGAFGLLLGPARFVNHDCRNNIEFDLKANNMGFKVTQDIEAGEQLFTNYGEHYFEEDNKSCLCSTCQQLKRGAFAPALVKAVPALSRRSSRSGSGHELTAQRSLARPARSASMSSLSSISSSRQSSPDSRLERERDKRLRDRTVAVDPYEGMKRHIHPRLKPPPGYMPHFRWDATNKIATYVGPVAMPSFRPPAASKPSVSKVALGKRKREDSTPPPSPRSSRPKGWLLKERKPQSSAPRRPITLGQRSSSRSIAAVFARLNAKTGLGNSDSELSELEDDDGDGSDSDISELTDLTGSSDLSELDSSEESNTVQGESSLAPHNAAVAAQGVPSCSRFVARTADNSTAVAKAPSHSDAARVLKFSIGRVQPGDPSCGLLVPRALSPELNVPAPSPPLPSLRTPLPRNARSSIPTARLPLDSGQPFRLAASSAPSGGNGCQDGAGSERSAPVETSTAGSGDASSSSSGNPAGGSGAICGGVAQGGLGASGAGDDKDEDEKRNAKLPLAEPEAMDIVPAREAAKKEEAEGAAVGDVTMVDEDDACSIAPSEGFSLSGRDEGDKEAVDVLLFMLARGASHAKSTVDDVPDQRYGPPPPTLPPSPPPTGSSKASTSSLDNTTEPPEPTPAHRGVAKRSRTDSSTPQTVTRPRSTRRNSAPIRFDEDESHDTPKASTSKLKAEPVSRAQKNIKSASPAASEGRRGRASLQRQESKRSASGSGRESTPREQSSDRRGTRRSEPIPLDVRQLIDSKEVMGVSGGYDFQKGKYVTTKKAALLPEKSPSPLGPALSIKEGPSSAITAKARAKSRQPSFNSSTEPRPTRSTNPLVGGINDLIASPESALVMGGYDPTTKRYFSKLAAPRHVDGLSPGRRRSVSTTSSTPSNEPETEDVKPARSRSQLRADAYEPSPELGVGDDVIAGSSTANAPAPETGRSTRRSHPIAGALQDLIASPLVSGVSGGFDKVSGKYTSRRKEARRQSERLESPSVGAREGTNTSA